MKTATKVSPTDKARSNISTKSNKSSDDSTKAVSLHPPTYNTETADTFGKAVIPEIQEVITQKQKPIDLRPKEQLYPKKTTLQPKKALYSTQKTYLTPKENAQPNAESIAAEMPQTPQLLRKTVPPKPDLQKKDAEKGLPQKPDTKKKNVEKIVTNQPSADKVIGFSQLSASEMAAKHGALDKEVKSQLQQDKQEEQKALKPRKAKLQGVEKLADQKPAVNAKQAANSREKQREADPAKPRLAEHQHHTDAPPKAEVPETKEQGGFFSRLFGSLADFLNGLSEMLEEVPEKDEGINTKAGKAPKQQLKGQANPDRANEQRQNREKEMQQEKDRMNTTIRQHPGPQNIQPLKMEASAEVPTLKNEVPDVQTEANEQMQNYLNVQAPPEVRELADKDMEEVLQPHLKESRGKLQKEIANQQQNRNEALEKNQQQLQKLNAEAQVEQEEKIRSARGEMHKEMQRSEAETERLMSEYRETAEHRHQEMNTEVAQRVVDDNTKAQRELDKGKEKAEELKEKAENDARKKREEAEDQKRDRNILQRAGDFLSDVWNAVTSAVKKLFEEARAAIKKVINAAKNAAIWLIEQGRKAIVGLINTFRKFLKDLVNTYLAKHFPALAKALNAAIDLVAKVAIKGVNYIADKLKKGVEALAKELAEAIDKVLAAIQEGVLTYLNVLGAVLSGDFGKALRIMFLALCKVAGVDPKVVMDFIEKAGDLIMTIFNDPMTFITNALNAVKKGVSSFATNILQHLGKGLLEWLMGPLGNLNIKMPEKFNLEGILSLSLQVLGLTYDNIRARAVKTLDKHYPGKGEQIIGTLEKTAGIVKEIITDGPKALWKHLKDFVGNIQQTIMDGIKSFVIERLVRAGIEMLIAMSNPVGGVIKLVSMLYDFVMFIVDNIERIAKFVKTIFDTVADIAAGKIETAAKFIESAMAQTIPMILDFLARLLKLGGISKKIQEIIERIRKPINKGIDKILELIVKLAKRVVSGIKGDKKDKKKKPGADGTPAQRKEAAKKEFIAEMQKNGGKMKKRKMRKLLKRLRVDYKLSKVTLEGTAKDPKVGFYASPALYLPMRQQTPADGQKQGVTPPSSPRGNDHLRATRFDKDILSPKDEAISELNRVFKDKPTTFNTGTAHSRQGMYKVEELTSSMGNNLFKGKKSKSTDSFDRPGKVNARTSKERGTGRSDTSGKDTLAGHFGQDERLIQGHPAPAGFYNGGHLVGDKLMDASGSFDLYEYWNLAPQFRKFNSPTYYQEIERPIENVLQENNARNANPINVVEYKVEVRYPSSQYTITTLALVQNIFQQQPSHPYRQQVEAAIAADPTLNETVTLHRRIPNYWRAHATIVAGNGRFETNVKARTGNATKPAMTFTNDPSKVRAGAAYNPTATDEEGIYRIRTAEDNGKLENITAPTQGNPTTSSDKKQIEFEGRQKTFSPAGGGNVTPTSNNNPSPGTSGGSSTTSSTGGNNRPTPPQSSNSSTTITRGTGSGNLGSTNNRSNSTQAQNASNTTNTNRNKTKDKHKDKGRVTDADRKRHKEISKEIKESMDKPLPQKPKNFEEYYNIKRRHAKHLQKNYQKELKKGVKLTITFNTLEEAKKKRKAKMKIVIRSNDLIESHIIGDDAFDKTIKLTKWHRTINSEAKFNHIYFLKDRMIPVPLNDRMQMVKGNITSQSENNKLSVMKGGNAYSYNEHTVFLEGSVITNLNKGGDFDAATHEFDHAVRIAKKNRTKFEEMKSEVFAFHAQMLTFLGEATRTQMGKINASNVVKAKLLANYTEAYGYGTGTKHENLETFFKELYADTNSIAKFKMAELISFLELLQKFHLNGTVFNLQDVQTNAMQYTGTSSKDPHEYPHQRYTEL